MAEEKPPLRARQGLFRLLFGMIGRPRATLEYLNEHGGRAWWTPAILAVLLLVSSVVVAAPIKTQQTRDAVLATQEQSGERQGRELTDEEQAQIVSVAASPLITVVFPTAASVAGLVVGWLVRAGGLYLAGMALGGRSTFRAMFRMVVWTWLPYVLRGLLQTVYILVSGQAIVNPGLSGLVQDNLPIGEVVVAPPGLGHTLLASFLSRVDLFLVWNLILLAIGVAVATRLSRRKAVLVTLAVLLLLTVLGLVPSLIGSLARQAGGF